ncbi:Membrin-11 [Ranunculus cassubicifolius]
MEGGTLSEIYQTSKRLSIKTRDGLERLERSSTNDSPELSMSINRDISQIQSLCTEMDRLWRSIGNQRNRDLWKRKVEVVAEEAYSFKESLDKYTQRNQRKMMEAKERAELFQRANGDGSHVMTIIDDERRAMDSARKSSLMIDEAYSTGVAILSKYAEQRDLLKRAQRKALDVLNTTSLSNSVLKLIERRHRVDKWIAYTGMTVTVIIVYLFWRWTH